MITRFLTDVSTVFNPFSPKAKTARIFLALFPANARQTVKIDTKMLPRSSRERSAIWVKFSAYFPPYPLPCIKLSMGNLGVRSENKKLTR